MKELCNPLTKKLLGHKPDVLVTEIRRGAETPCKITTHIWSNLASVGKVMYTDLL